MVADGFTANMKSGGLANVHRCPRTGRREEEDHDIVSSQDSSQRSCA